MLLRVHHNFVHIFSFSTLKGGKKIYNCVLGLVDIVRGTNSYYKLQVLESDKKNRYGDLDVT